jgi:hypothetical protein
MENLIISPKFIPNFFCHIQDSLSPPIGLYLETGFAGCTGFEKEKNMIKMLLNSACTNVAYSDTVKTI